MPRVMRKVERLRPLVIRQIREWLDATDDPKYIGRFGGYEILGAIGHGGRIRVTSRSCS